MVIRILRKLSRLILYTIAKVDLINYHNLPDSGGCLVISNHVGRLDVLLGFVLANRDDVIIMIAEKYRRVWLIRVLCDWLDTVWVSRDGTDLRALREIQRRLQAGQIAVIAPEGTRSKTEALQPAKQGAVYLAAKANVPIVPVALVGTEDREVKRRLKRLRRLHIEMHVGKPFFLPPLPRKNKDAFFAEATDEMMGRVAVMLPERYRGVYAEQAAMLQKTAVSCYTTLLF